VIADCCFALGPALKDFAGSFVCYTIRALNNSNIAITDRISICEVFGAIARAIGPHFRTFVLPVMGELEIFYAQLTLTNLAQELPSDDEERFLEILFGIVNSIVRALKNTNGNGADDFYPFIPFVMNVIAFVSTNMMQLGDPALESMLSAANEIMASTRVTFGFEEPLFTDIIEYCLRERPAIAEAALSSKTLLCTLIPEV